MASKTKTAAKEKEKDVEIARAEELYRADFFETCRRIASPSRSVSE